MVKSDIVYIINCILEYEYAGENPNQTFISGNIYFSYTHHTNNNSKVYLNNNVIIEYKCDEDNNKIIPKKIYYDIL